MASAQAHLSSTESPAHALAADAIREPVLNAAQAQRQSRHRPSARRSATGSAAPAGDPSSVRRVSAPRAGIAFGSAPAAQRAARRRALQHRRPSRACARRWPAARRALSARSGARTCSRWQRLSMVAGRRRGLRGHAGSAACAGGGSSSVFSSALAAKRFMRVGRRQDGHLVAAPWLVSASSAHSSRTWSMRDLARVFDRDRTTSEVRMLVARARGGSRGSGRRARRSARGTATSCAAQVAS